MSLCPVLFLPSPKCDCASGAGPNLLVPPTHAPQPNLIHVKTHKCISQLVPLSQTPHSSTKPPHLCHTSLELRTLAFRTYSVQDTMLSTKGDVCPWAHGGHNEEMLWNPRMGIPHLPGAPKEATAKRRAFRLSWKIAQETNILSGEVFRIQQPHIMLGEHAALPGSFNLVFCTPYWMKTSERKAFSKQSSLGHFCKNLISTSPTSLPQKKKF